MLSRTPAKVDEMKSANIRIRRPWIHHVIIGAYILAPLANILMVRFSVGVPLATILQRLFRGYGPLAATWLLTAPIVGLALYFVHRWSWYVFLAHSSLVFADFAIKIIANPLLFLRTIPPLNHVLILAGNLALVALIGTIIRRDFRWPYLEEHSRSFRWHRRTACACPVMLNATPALVTDLSIGGCFVRVASFEAAPQEAVHLSLATDAGSLEIDGRIARATPSGVGIMFLALDRQQRAAIWSLIRRRTIAPRHSIPKGWAPQA